MHFTFSIVSQVNPRIPVTMVTVEADGPRHGKKQAKHVARTQFGILKPVVVDDERIRREHQAALEIRRQVATMRPPMPNLNGRCGAWWRQCSIAPLYDEK